MTVEQNRRHLYTCAGITVAPDPPQVGVPTSITLKLTNSGAEPLALECVELMVARFGMGITWEHLTPFGPLTIPAQQSKHVNCTWMPKHNGHSCIRARISGHFANSPLCVGRNTRVRAAATPGFWRTPFALGNPVDRPAEIRLIIEHDPRLLAMIALKKRLLLSGETIALAIGEETEGVLLLSSSTSEVPSSLTTVEAFVEGQFVDGMAVLATTPGPEADVPADHPPVATSPQQPSASADFPGNESGNWNLWRP